MKKKKTTLKCRSGLFFPLISDAGTKLLAMWDPVSTNRNSEFTKWRAGIRVQPELPSVQHLTSRALYTLHTTLTSALSWPSCLLHICRALPLPNPTCQTAIWHWLQNYHQLQLGWGDQGTWEKIGCFEKAGDTSSRQAFCWKKQPKSEVPFLPHSWTKKKVSQLSTFACQETSD